MKTTFILLFALTLNTWFANGQGTTFTYQGRLAEDRSPANGNYDLRFMLQDALTEGNAVGAPVNAFAKSVSNGLFVATLDFGASAFDGNPRFLEVAVRPAGSTNAFQVLVPRQFVSSTPYAIQAATASALQGTLSDAQLSANVPRLNGTNVFTGPVSVNPASLSVTTDKKILNLNADKLDGFDSGYFWKIGGNTGTSPITNFLGTFDNQPLDFRANNRPAMRLDPNGNVGIGTNSPGDKMHIESGSLRITGSGPVYEPSATGLRLGGGPSGQNGFSWIQSWDGPLAINSYANNVGIGIANPQAKLEVEGSHPQLRLGNPSAGSGVQLDFMDGGVLRQQIGHLTSSHNLQFGTGGTDANGTGLTPVMTLNPTGNVGIGTSTPAAALAVVSSGGNPLFLQRPGGGAWNALLTSHPAGDSSNPINYNSLTLRSEEAGADFAIRADNTGDPQFVVKASGNVGIGTTAPEAALEVVRGGEGSALDLVKTGGSGPVFRVFKDVPKSGALLAFTVQRDGNVGIGTPNPTVPLEVQAAAGGDIVRFRTPNRFLEVSDTGGGIRLTANGGGPGNESPMPLGLRTATSGEAQLFINTSGNVGIGTTTPLSKLHTRGGIFIESPIGELNPNVNAGGRSGINFGANQIGQSYWWISPSLDGALQMGTGLEYGDNFPAAQTMLRLASSGDLVVKGDVYARGVKLTSDRNAKKMFAGVSSGEVLDRVLALPIQTWSYTNDADNVRHIGPMAQDFHAAFRVGDDDKHIATVDADGVALAAIQGLNEKLEEKISEKDDEIAALKKRLSTLESLLTSERKRNHE